MKRKEKPLKTKQTQMKIADTLGISQPTVSNWLLLRTKPTGLQRAALQTHYPVLLERIETEWSKRHPQE